MSSNKTKVRIDMDKKIKERPNEATIKAMKEADAIAKNPSVKGYTDLDKMFKDLKS